jgi:hypothetical protein
MTDENFKEIVNHKDTLKKINNVFKNDTQEIDTVKSIFYHIDNDIIHCRIKIIYFNPSNPVKCENDPYSFNTFAPPVQYTYEPIYWNAPFQYNIKTHKWSYTVGTGNKATKDDTPDSKSHKDTDISLKNYIKIKINKQIEN